MPTVGSTKAYVNEGNMANGQGPIQKWEEVAFKCAQWRCVEAWWGPFERWKEEFLQKVLSGHMAEASGHLSKGADDVHLRHVGT